MGCGTACCRGFFQFLYETLGSYDCNVACLMGYYVLLAVPMAKASSHLLALFSV